MTKLDIHVSNLLKSLEENHFDTLDISSLSLPNEGLTTCMELDISAQVHEIGTGMAIHYRQVELTGARNDFRRLALILFVQALIPLDQYLVIRLREPDANALILAPVPHPLDFFEIQPLSLRYKHSWYNPELTRFDLEVEDRDRPHIGFFDDADPQLKIGHDLPSWVNQAVFISGMANARVRLAASILDNTHPRRMGDFRLGRTWEQVGSLSYDLLISLED